MFRPYDRVWFRGVRMNRRTKRMLKWAEKRAGFTFNVAQGSYNGNAVAASAGTHSGGGSLDLGMAGVSKANRVKAVRALKDAGFAAWYRKPSQGFSPHVHAQAFGDREMAASGKAQRASFDRGRDGLAYDRRDSTYRPKPKRGFSFTLNKPKVRK